MSAETAAPALAEVLTRYMEAGSDWTPPAPAAPTTPPPGGPGTPAVAPVIHLAQLADLPAPAWLIESILPQNALACVYGPPGAGKTFLTLAWALAVATGQPWAAAPTRAGGVLYIAAEGHTGLHARVRAWETQVAPARHTGCYVLLSAINLMDDTAVASALAGLAAAGGQPSDVALIVVDTLARCMGGGDENSARDMGRAIAGADRLRQATGATVVLVHHTGKANTVERGSSALRGACDVMVSVTADDGVVTVECDKMKDAAPFPVSRWRLVERAGSCVLLPTDADAGAVLAPPERSLTPASARCWQPWPGPSWAAARRCPKSAPPPTWAIARSTARFMRS